MCKEGCVKKGGIRVVYCGGGLMGMLKRRGREMGAHFGEERGEGRRRTGGLHNGRFAYVVTSDEKKRRRGDNNSVPGILLKASTSLSYLPSGIGAGDKIVSLDRQAARHLVSFYGGHHLRNDEQQVFAYLLVFNLRKERAK